MKNSIISINILIKIIFLLLASVSFAMVATAAISAAVPSPVKVLKEASDLTVLMIKKDREELIAKHQLSADDPLPFPNTVKIIEKVLLPHINLAHISQATVSPAVWRKATLQQQKKFMEAFKSLLINTYGAALANYKNEAIQFFKIRGGYEGLEQVQVKSKIFQQNRNSINVDYLMLLDKKSNQWYVIDMSVEGISLLESFRSQFESELKQGGMDQLLKTLAKHNVEVVQRNTLAKKVKQKTS